MRFFMASPDARFGAGNREATEHWMAIMKPAHWQVSVDAKEVPPRDGRAMGWRKGVKMCGKNI